MDSQTGPAAILFSIADESLQTVQNNQFAFQNFNFILEVSDFSIFFSYSFCECVGHLFYSVLGKIFAGQIYNLLA